MKYLMNFGILIWNTKFYVMFILLGQFIRLSQIIHVIERVKIWEEILWNVSFLRKHCQT